MAQGPATTEPTTSWDGTIGLFPQPRLPPLRCRSCSSTARAPWLPHAAKGFELRISARLGARTLVEAEALTTQSCATGIAPLRRPGRRIRRPTHRRGRASRHGADDWTRSRPRRLGAGSDEQQQLSRRTGSRRCTGAPSLGDERAHPDNRARSIPEAEPASRWRRAHPNNRVRSIPGTDLSVARGASKQPGKEHPRSPPPGNEGGSESPAPQGHPRGALRDFSVLCNTGWARPT